MNSVTAAYLSKKMNKVSQQKKQKIPVGFSRCKLRTTRYWSVNISTSFDKKIQQLTNQLKLC